MSEDRSASSKPKTRGRKPPREAYNIQFAQGLCGDAMLDIIQHELLRARSKKPPTEATLPTAILHDIKYRLTWYLDKYGEVERDAPDKVGVKKGPK